MCDFIVEEVHVLLLARVLESIERGDLLARGAEEDRFQEDDVRDVEDREHFHHFLQEFILSEIGEPTGWVDRAFAVPQQDERVHEFVRELVHQRLDDRND